MPSTPDLRKRHALGYRDKIYQRDFDISEKLLNIFERILNIVARFLNTLRRLHKILERLIDSGGTYIEL